MDWKRANPQKLRTSFTAFVVMIKEDRIVEATMYLRKITGLGPLDARGLVEAVRPHIKPAP